MTKIKTQLWLQITLNILLNFLEKQIILHFTKLNYLPGYTCKFNKILTPPNTDQFLTFYILLRMKTTKMDLTLF